MKRRLIRLLVRLRLYRYRCPPEVNSTWCKMGHNLDYFERKRHLGRVYFCGDFPVKESELLDIMEGKR